MTEGSPIWPKASPERVAQGLSAHSVLGLAAGALLYLVCLSGSLLVFEKEIAWWEEPGAPHIAVMTPEAVQAAAYAVAEADPQPTSHLIVYPPTPQSPRGTAATDQLTVSIDAEGRIVHAHHAPWSEFLVGLHYYLHLPSTFGMVFVGVLGVVMLALSISGFLAHPSIFRTAFAMRRDGSPRVAEIDLHNRLAVWSAPFHLVVSFTGAWIGIFALVAVVIAQIGFDGDRAKVGDTIFSWELPADETPAPLPNIAGAMRYMAETYPNLIPIMMLVHEPGTAGQHVQVLAEHPDRLILGEYYNFDAEGRFYGTVGLADGALGQQVAMSVYPLHFGTFGGLPVRIAYMLLGFGLCVVIATGLNTYFIKRQEKRRPAPRLWAMWTAVVWGAPAALALTLVASVLGTDGQVLVPTFWLVLMVATALASVWPRRDMVGNILRLIAGAALLFALAAHFALHRDESTQALAVPAVDIAIISSALMLIVASRRLVLR